MDCILFRHGIAVEREEWEGREADRPLTAKGAEKTEQSARGLLRLGVAPTHLLSSPLVRAVQTADIIARVFELPDNVPTDQALLPDAPPDRLMSVLAKLPGSACIICIGHEPQLSDAAGLMLAGGPIDGLILKKAGACCIRFEGSVKPGEGTLRWWLMARQLRALRE